MNEKTVQLLALRISNGALAAHAAGKLPARLKLLDWGENKSVKGPVRVSDLSLQSLAQNQSARGFAEIALDFEHNTVPGSLEFERTPEPRKVAAFGTPRIVPNEGLFLENLRWTPAGQADALNYADLSPAVELDAQGNIMFVHSAALTRNGAVDGLSFFSVTIPNQNPMEAFKPENLITVAEIAPALGLAASASKADVLGQLSVIAVLAAAVPFKEGKPVSLFGAELREGKLTLLDAVPSLEHRLKKIEDAKNLTVLSVEDFVKLRADHDKLAGALTQRDQASDETERARLITDAGREGKVIPLSAATLKTFPTAALKEMIGKLPPGIVPLNSRQKPGDGREVPAAVNTAALWS